MLHDLLPPPAPTPPREAAWARAGAVGRGVRRRVLVHRRLIAAVLMGMAVLCGLRVLQPPSPATDAVWVAAADLTSGQTVSRSDLVRQAMAPDAVPDGTLSAERLVGARVAGPMRRGEVLTDRRVLGSSSLADRPGTVAVPVRPADPAVAGLLRVGDRIDLIRVDPNGSDERLATDVEVLAVTSPANLSDTSASSATAAAGQGGLVVLAVEEDVADEVAAAGLDGFLAVTLGH